MDLASTYHGQRGRKGANSDAYRIFADPKIPSNSLGDILNRINKMEMVIDFLDARIIGRLNKSTDRGDFVKVIIHSCFSFLPRGRRVPNTPCSPSRAHRHNNEARSRWNGLVLCSKHAISVF